MERKTTPEPRSLPPTPSTDDAFDASLQPPVTFRKTCPLCNGRSRVAFSKHGIPISDCAACSHRYAEYDAGAEHVENVYDDSYFEGGAGEYAGYELEAETLRERGAWYGRLLRRFLPDGSNVLDVGAASGQILEGLRKAGWSGVGLEPNPTMAARARERGLDVRNTTIEDVRLDEPMDAITIVQVLPHLLDLHSAMRRVRDLTTSGGVCLIETWDRDSLVARVLGQRWHEYNPPSVLHWFSKSSLRALLVEHGFTFIASGKPPKSISGAHAKSLLTSDTHSILGRAIGATASLLPDTFNLPYPGDDVFWMAFRKDPGG